MTQLFELIIWICRRGPIALGALALAILGVGYYLQIGQNDRNLQKLAALDAGPPAAVDITQFDRDRDVTDQKEVVVRAQAVLEDAYRLTLEKDGSDDFAFMVPLVSPTAANDQVLFGIALFTSSQFSEDDVTPELLKTGVVDFGNYGPIVEYNGRVSGLGQWDELVNEALDIEGMTLAANSVMVRPYLEGREAALTPSDTTIFGLLSKIAGAIGLFALGKLVFNAKSGGKTPPEPQEPQAQPYMQTPDAVVADTPEPTAVPLWKQRAGLVDPSDYQPTPTTPIPLTTPTMAAPIVPKRSGFGVRKVLIGIVGGLFVLGLVSVVTDLIMDSSANTAVAVSSQEDLAAATVADALVPDADPNRHWTDIDVTPVIEWVVAKFFLAVSGDTDAQITLGMIFGGLFIALFLLRVYITARLSSTLSRRRSYSFDDLTSGG